ncbi:MAG: hypothetical protein AAF730_18510 [Bacteroidota bacterium]
MSWLIGWTGEAAAAPALPRELHRHSEARWGVAQGGLRATCRWGHHPESGWAWGVVGLGMRLGDDGLHPLTDADWHALIPRAADALRDQLRRLNGHFVLVRWSAEEIQAFTDPLGTRTLYYAQHRQQLHLATRLDTLAHQVEATTLNLGALGAHWLTFNQLSYDALLEGVGRLGPGGMLRYDRATDRLSVDAARWMPDADAPAHPPMQVLDRLLRVHTPDERMLSLGLSGGLDSRLLLSVLSGRDANYALHTFGDASDPDVLLSEQLAQAVDAPRQHLAYPDPSAEDVLAIIQRHVVQTCATIPATAALKLAAYAPLEAQHRVMIDGGFGEIGRRQFLNRLRYRQQVRFSGQALLPAFTVHRADVFAPDVTRTLRQGAEAQLAEVFAQAQAAAVDGLANQLDLLSIWTRLPNFFGHEQARLDAEVVNYMPFAQPAFLSAILAAPVGRRRHGRLYKRAIRQRTPALADLPLAKSGTTYPFGASTVGAWGISKVKKRWGEHYTDLHRAIYLQRLEPMVRDLASEAMRVPLYDAGKVERIVNGFYSGDASQAVPLDWWLAFELWRQAIQAPSL